MDLVSKIEKQKNYQSDTKLNNKQIKIIELKLENNANDI
jgi:hypothetical protein